METAGGLPLCARCERDDSNYISPDAKMWYTPCNHAICERCKQDLFSRHRMQKCPAKHCSSAVGVQELSAETKESKEFAEEKKIRKRLAATFTQTLADFNGDSAAYDAHLEMVEKYVYALVHGNEAEKAATESAIAAYRTRNQHAISSNLARAQVAEQRERERQRQESEVRSAAAVAALAAEARKRAIASALRSHLMDTLLGAGEQDKDGGKGASAVAGADLGAEGGLNSVLALKQRLLMLQAQRLAGGSDGAAIQAWFVPCAHVPPPRFLEYTHTEWHAAHGKSLLHGPHTSDWDMDVAAVRAHARAGGFSQARYAAAVQEDIATMLWA